MDDYDMMYKTICRLCLSQNSVDKMVSLIDNSNDDGLSCFGKAISMVTNVLLQKGDKLPTMMCQKCILLLKQTIYFKLKCETTEKQLKQLAQGKVNSDVSDRHIKEIVCQYVMFNQYFPSNIRIKTPTKSSSHRKALKSNSFSQKIAQKPSTSKDVDVADDTYNFDDDIENEDSNHIHEKKEKYSNDVNNFLDTIQNLINTGNCDTFTPCAKRKLKREQRQQSKPTKERNLICKICNKTLANRLTYNHHMQRHDKSICRYICEECGKGFPVLTEMHMHQVARHGTGPYLQCDHCTYKAPRKLDLIEHLRLHTGERPFTCEKCGLTFRRKAIYRNHIVLHMEKKYQCSYCPRKFYRQGSMLAHCNNIHERLYMYVCSICSVTYAKTETVKRHMAIKHGIPREKQGKIVRIMNGNNEIRDKVV